MTNPIFQHANILHAEYQSASAIGALSPQTQEHGCPCPLLIIFIWQKSKHARALCAKEEEPNMPPMIAAALEVRHAIPLPVADLSNWRVDLYIHPLWPMYMASAMHTRHGGLAI